MSSNVVLFVFLSIPGKIISGVMETGAKYGLALVTGGTVSLISTKIKENIKERGIGIEESSSSIVCSVKKAAKLMFKTVLNPENIMLGLYLSPELYALGVVTDGIAIVLRPILYKLLAAAGK
jgi:hypothetical protein